MLDPNIARLRSQQQQAQQRLTPKPPTTGFRIGDRDPIRGTHQLIYPDGSKDPTGIKAYNAAHQPGDPVLAQQRTDGRWVMNDAVGRRTKRRSSAKPMPTREKPKNLLWVLYLKDGGLWVGGNSPEPVRIGEASAIYGIVGPFTNSYGWTYYRRASIWGDASGWIVQTLQGGGLGRDDIIPAIPSAPVVKLVNYNETGSTQELLLDTLNRRDLPITPPSNRIDGVDYYYPVASNRIDYYPRLTNWWPIPLGGGNWEISGNIVERYVGPLDVVQRRWDQGVWGNNGLTVSPMIFKKTESPQVIVDSQSGQASILGRTKVENSDVASLNPSNGISTALFSRSTNINRLWASDRYSALAVQFETKVYEAENYGIYQDSVKLGLKRYVGDQIEQLGDKTIGYPDYYYNNPEFYGLSFHKYYFEFGSNFGWIDALTNLRSELPYSGPDTPTAELWYTEGKIIKVFLSDINMLKFGSREVPISEIAIDGTMTQSTTFGYEIPPDATILAYCGSKL
jgi:hypothetical protein